MCEAGSRKVTWPFFFFFKRANPPPPQKKLGGGGGGEVRSIPFVCASIVAIFTRLCKSHKRTVESRDAVKRTDLIGHNAHPFMRSACPVKVASLWLVASSQYIAFCSRHDMILQNTKLIKIKPLEGVKIVFLWF